MTEQELRKLNRGELLELIREQEKAMDALQARIVTMERQQRERSYRMKKFGSLAEASLQLNGVFDAAQRAANQYLESAAQMSAACKQQKELSDQLLAETKRKCAQMEADTERKCKELLDKTEADAKAYWQAMEQDLVRRLEDYVPEWHLIDQKEAAKPEESEEEPEAAVSPEEAEPVAAEVSEPASEAVEIPAEEPAAEEAEPESEEVNEAVEDAPQPDTEAEEMPAFENEIIPEQPPEVEDEAFDLDEIKRLLGDL